MCECKRECEYLGGQAEAWLKVWDALGKHHRNFFLAEKSGQESALKEIRRLQQIEIKYNELLLGLMTALEKQKLT
jgi:hypothetical protein